MGVSTGTYVSRKSVNAGKQRICLTCEYFDGGGQKLVNDAKLSGEPLHGDCLCSASPRFQTWSNQFCIQWTKSTGDMS